MKGWAVITGAGSGIGREIARILTRQGYRLLLVGRNPARLAELFPKAETVRLDLSDEAETAAFADRLARLDPEILVNAAGIGRAGFGIGIGRTEEEILRVNALAPQILSRTFAGLSEAGEIGRPRYLLNVCSASAFLPAPLFSAYASSKAYLFRYTRALCEEERQRKSGVRVTAGCPGPVRTGFDEKSGMKGTRKGMSADRCAQRLVKDLFRGKAVSVPGGAAKLFRLAAKVLPEGALLRLSYRYRVKMI